MSDYTSVIFSSTLCVNISQGGEILMREFMIFALFGNKAILIFRVNIN